MAAFKPVYKLIVYKPRREDPTETAVLTPLAGAVHADPFQIATTTGIAGFQPYLGQPKGRRGRIDVLSKRTDTGSMSFRCQDPRTTPGGSNLERWITAFVGDERGRNRMLGCKVVVLESLDNGATWDDFFTGRVQRYPLVGRLWFDLHLRDMADALDVDIFVGVPHSSVAYATPAPLLPNRPITEYGSATTSLRVRGSIAAGGLAPNSKGVVVDHSQPPFIPTIVTTAVAELEQSAPVDYKHPTARVYLQRLDTLEEGTFHLAQLVSPIFINRVLTRYIEKSEAEGIISGDPQEDFHPPMAADKVGIRPLDPTAPGYLAMPPDGTEVELHLLGDNKPSKKSPLLIGDVHPVQLWADLLDGKFGRLKVDGTTGLSYPRDVAAFDALVADTSFPTVRFLIDESAKLNKFFEDYILPVANLGYRLDASGKVVPIDLRLPDVVPAVPTITTTDLAADRKPDWNPDRGGTITRVEITHYVEEPVTNQELLGSGATHPDVPASMIRETDLLYIPVDFHAEAEGGAQKHEIDARGLRAIPDEMINGQNRLDWVRRTLDDLVEQLRGPFSHGSITALLPCRRTAATEACQVGDWRIIAVDELPNPASNLRGGNRLMRCVERTEEGPIILLGFLDAGAAAVAVVPVVGTPVVNAADSHAVDVPVTLNAAGEPVVLQIAVTDSSELVRPAEGSPLWTHALRVSATSTVPVTNVPDGMRIWVRARTLATEATEAKLPSPWVHPGGTDYVDLPAVLRIKSLDLTVDDDGVPTVDCEPSASTAGLRIYYDIHDRTADAVLTDFVDISAAAVPFALPVEVPAQSRITVEVEPWSTWTGAAVGGTAGPRVRARATRPVNLEYLECRARITATTATTVTVTVDGLAPAGTTAPTVQLVAVSGAAALASGPAIGVASPTGTSWIFNRAAINAGAGQAQFRTVLAGYQGDDDLVAIEEQGRDTVPLLMRASVQSTTETQVVVRVAVADPHPENQVTVFFTAAGVGTVTPTSGEILAGITDDIDTTGFVDFTIPRAALGSGTGRVTFTAFSMERTSDSDAVDVPAQDREVGPSLEVSVAKGAESDTITWSGTGIVELSIDDGPYAAPPPSPIVVAKNDLGGAEKSYVFRATKAGQIVNEIVTVSAKTEPNPPTANVFPEPDATDPTGASPTLTYSGALGTGASGPLTWRRRVVIGDWAVDWPATWETSVLPQLEVITAMPKFDKRVELQVQDGGGRITQASWTVRATMRGLGRTTGGVDDGQTMEGGFLPFGRGRDTLTDVLDDGSFRRVNTEFVTAGNDLYQVFRSGITEPVTNLFKRGADTLTDVLDDGSYRRVNSEFVTVGNEPYQVYRNSTTEPVANLFKRSTDTLAQVLDSPTHRRVAVAYTDTSHRLANVYRSAVVESAANLFKRGTDTLADVLDSATHRRVAVAYTDTSHRLANVYRSAVVESAANLFKRGANSLTDVLDDGSFRRVHAEYSTAGNDLFQIQRSGLVENAANLFKKSSDTLSAVLDDGSFRRVNAGFITAGNEPYQVYRSGIIEPVTSLFKKNADTLDQVVDGATFKRPTQPQLDQAAAPSQNLCGAGAGAEASQGRDWLDFVAIADLNLAAGDVLSFSAEMYAEAGSLNHRPRLRFFDGGTLLETHDGAPQVSTAAWTRSLKQGITIPAGTTTLDFAHVWSSGAGKSRRGMLNRGPIALKFEDPPVRANRETIGVLDGVLQSTVQASDGAAAKLLPKGVKTGTVVNGGVIVFDTVYNSPPVVRFEGGAMDQGASVWDSDPAVADTGGATARPTGLVVQSTEADVTASGFTAHLYLVGKGSPAARSAVFSGPTTVTSEGSSTGSATPATGDVPSLDGTYEASFRINCAALGGGGDVAVEVALDVAKNGGAFAEVGSTWVMVAVPDASSESVNASIQAAVDGIAGGDDAYRLRVKTVVPGGGATFTSLDLPELDWYEDSGALYASMTPNGEADAVKFFIMARA